MQVTGDDTTVLEAVLACDTERSQLLQEEATLMQKFNKEPVNGPAATGPGTDAAAPSNGQKAAQLDAEKGAPTANGVAGSRTTDAAAPSGDGSAEAMRLQQVSSTLSASGCVCVHGESGAGAVAVHNMVYMHRMPAFSMSSACSVAFI